MNRRSRDIEGITKRNVETIAKIEEASNSGRTFGQRVADFATKWVGSWAFVIGQSALLVVWIVINFCGLWKAWNPYPFILLNLVMSFESAFATPVILMSQNRQSKIADRRNHLDLQINLLAEQENTVQLKLLRLLCEKAGISLSEPDEVALEQALQPDRIIQQIASNVETKDPMR